ncbi:MAG: hypothetical protein LBQ34_03250 [Alphaproteobacteria bacterium]|jgi:uncharacterized membrane protein|nr:hypothetical protein [Alphaproteobacteria bacterium]
MDNNNVIIEQESVDLDEKKRSLIRDLEALKTRVEKEIPTEIPVATAPAAYNTTNTHNNDMQSQMIIPPSSMIEDSYSFSAKKEHSQSFAFKVIGLTLIIVAAIMSYFLFNPSFLNIDSLSGGSLFFLILPLILILALIAYILVIERRHAKKAQEHRNLSLKHSLLDVYLREIPKNDSDTIKVELAKYLFTNISKDNK